MAKIGLSIDYNNICKDYNTVYLDRDNDDRATINCMNKVTTWLNGFLTEMVEKFNYQAHLLNIKTPVKIDVIAARRFLFYSLEKDITIQTFVLEEKIQTYMNLSNWDENSSSGIAIKNDDEGEGFYIYLEKDSEIYKWIKEKLSDFSLDELPLP